MTDVEDDELRVLARARRSATPSPRDAEEVRGKLLRALAAMPAPNAGLSETRSIDEKKARWASQGAAALERMHWVHKLGMIAAIGVAGAGGYALGRYHGQDAAGAAVTARASPPRPAATLKDELGAAPARSTASAVEPASDPVADVASQTPSRRLAETPRPAGSIRQGGDEVIAPPSLFDEAQLLTRIERALRRGNVQYARALLDELRRTVPEGQLVEERQAAAVMIACRLGSNKAAGLLQEFRHRYPLSAYLARVEENCGSSGKSEAVDSSERIGSSRTRTD